MSTESYADQIQQQINSNYEIKMKEYDYNVRSKIMLKNVLRIKHFLKMYTNI